MGHLQENGFRVNVTEVDDIVASQNERAVPRSVRGCHSARIGGYMVEGHVPAQALERFLEEHPEAAGISVPGMVIGPPGMEGSRPVPYDVVTFDEEGNVTHFESRLGSVRGGSN